MTRKDYELLAATIATRVRITKLVRPGPSQQLSAVDSLARELAINLAVENPAFDRARFLSACGVQS